MTTPRITHDRSWALPRSVPGAERARTWLLAGGILSSLLYVATDVLGGMRYGGYSFTSQAISELMATGARSERLVDPLFLIYDVLVLAFGAGVFLEGLRRGRALAITGGLLFLYGVVGFTGPTLFEMHPRGTGVSDTPHIVLTMVISALLLIAMGFGARAFDKRFRFYSVATIAVVVVAGGVTGYAGRNLTAGLPTPWFGLLERVDIYATMLWIAVLALWVMRRNPTGGLES